MPVRSRPLLMKTPRRIRSLRLVCTCSQITLPRWEQLMAGATRANKRVINRLIREHLPDLYRELRLDLHNPYAYFKTRDHLIMVHSGIEYFLAYGRSGDA